MSRPNLLFISPRFLFPLDQGGRIRTANTLRAMKGGLFKIVLASPAPTELAPWQAELDRVCDRFVSWPEPVRSPTWRAATALFGRLPMPVASDRTGAAREAVRQALAARPDVVLVDFPHAAVLLPKGLIGRPSVMFTHNVEAEIFARHAEVARGAMCLIWRRQARLMQRFEAETLCRFDSVIAVSARDATALRRAYGLPRVETIETGVDLEFFSYAAPAPVVADGGTVVFSGSMDSRSNIDGIEFLMNEVWPMVSRRRPRTRMLVVGRNPPQRLVVEAARRGLAWSFTGFVDDIRPHLRGGNVAVIPLRVGSGTRIKAFEAMALGLPVVSTTLGVEGLAVEPGRHFLAADDAAEFATAILDVLGQPTLAARLSQSARSFLEERFSWAQVGRQFERICAGVLVGQPAAPKPTLAI